MDSSTADSQNEIIQRVFAFTLNEEAADAGSRPPVVHLTGLAQELENEAPGAPLLLNKGNLERALMARLMDPPDAYPQWPVPYLLACYARASEQFRALPAQLCREQLQELLLYGKELAVSYTGLLLTMGMFPQPPEAEQRGALQLLDAVMARTQQQSSGVQMPLDFLDQFATRFESEGLPDVMAPLGRELMRQLSGMSALGNFGPPLAALSLLSGIAPAARALVQLKEFLPPALGDGRAISLWTVLGAAFSIGIMTDRVSPAQPDVRQQYLSHINSRSASEISSAVTSLQLTANQLADTLHTIVRSLLKKDTRDRMLEWLFKAVETNQERNKTMPNHKVAASDAFFVNLGAVCLKLCQPFMEPSAKTWARIDAEYVTLNDHLSFAEETKLSASQEEEKKWVEERRAASPAQPPAYPFICEAFFMTAKVLHMGPVHVLSQRDHLAKQVARWEQDAQQIAHMLESMEGPQKELLQRQQAQLTAAIDKYKGEVVLMDAHLQDPALTRDMLAYYRLMAAWLLHLASPGTAVGADIELPLPTPAPMAFRTMPEYIVEDMVDVLEWVAQALPQAMESMQNNEFVNFIIVFLGSPAYIRNAHLRAKLVDLLYIWISPQLREDGRASMRRTSAISSLISLIEWHPVVQQNMVRALLQLFIDIEHTDRHNTFYEKFETRYKAGEILCYLWTVPQHREVWKALAAEKGGRGVYLAFCDVICNDSQFLLDDVIRTLPEVRELEDLIQNSSQLQQLSAEERAEKEKTLREKTQMLRSDLYLASVYIRLMRTSMEDITTSWLLPEMVSRVALMLNYFLAHLAGKEKRKNLRVRDPEKYNWKPQQLLEQLGRIYLQLSRADNSGGFVSAIAMDERSYQEGLFSDAADVLRRYRLLGEAEVDELEALGEAVQLAKLAAAADDEVLGEVPDEFLDPVTFEIMTDPVRLPRSGGGEAISMDRATITRHLLSNKTDPFSKQPLTVDLLEPNDELKAQIQAWKQAQRQKAPPGTGPMQQ